MRKDKFKIFHFNGTLAYLLSRKESPRGNLMLTSECHV